jgi:hypothetical protein
MDERQVPGYLVGNARCVMILMTSGYSRREHEDVGPVLVVKGDAGHFAA